jgi:capsular polysaccharide biosynthesis protein
MRPARDVRWPLIVLIVAVGVAAGLGVAYAQSRREPTLYRAQTSLVVERGNQPLVGSEGLISTLRRLVRSNVVATDVIGKLGLDESAAKLLHRLSVAKSGSSAVLRIQAEAGDPATATKIATQVGESFTQEVGAHFPAVQIAVFDPAHALPGKASPQRRRDLAWGALLGLLVGLLVANLGVRQRPEQRSLAGLRVLGDAGSPDDLAKVLMELSVQLPFQTVALAGDPDGAVAASLAHALAERGALTIWVRAADADGAELERLAARCAFVLVAGATFDPNLSVDAAIAVTSPANVGIADRLVRQPGLRILGTVAMNGSGE